MPTLFERLGGEAAISAVVDKFYEYMIADAQIKEFFKNTDLNKQRKRQTQYMVLVTGGPNKYEGHELKGVHANLGIHKSQFDKSWTYMEKACHDLKVPAALLPEVKTVFYASEKDVVTKH